MSFIRRFLRHCAHVVADQIQCDAAFYLSSIHQVTKCSKDSVDYHGYAQGEGKEWFGVAGVLHPVLNRQDLWW